MGNPFECDAEIEGFCGEDFWQLLNNWEFEVLLQNMLGTERFEELELTIDNEGGQKRSVRVAVPNTVVPTALWNTALWYMGTNDFAHVNNETRHATKREMVFTTDPPCFQDTLKVGGHVKCIDIDETHCRLSLRGETEMNSWLNVGSVIESTIVAEIKRSYDLLPTIVKEWRKRQAEGASSMAGFEKPCEFKRAQK